MANNEFNGSNNRVERLTRAGSLALSQPRKWYFREFTRNNF
jgi:hypothetical protein